MINIIHNNYWRLDFQNLFTKIKQDVKLIKRKISQSLNQYMMMVPRYVIRINHLTMLEGMSRLRLSKGSLSVRNRPLLFRSIRRLCARCHMKIFRMQLKRKSIIETWICLCTLSRLGSILKVTSSLWPSLRWILQQDLGTLCACQTLNLQNSSLMMKVLRASRWK